ncbi:hypothetical protein V6N00_16135 [Tersicoccus sp. MR15.9]|uniref:hypothetical protein n=1 Tax=Tersicoccus mangrovi TaxID=3121635 RepID=UPI002FE5B17C
MISKLKLPDGEKLVPLPASKVRQAAGSTNQTAKSATVTPAVCKTISLKASSIPQDAAVGVGQAARSKVLLSLVMSKDTAELKSRVTGARQLLNSCSAVTLKTATATVHQTLKELSMAKVGDDSVAVLNVQQTSGITVEMTQVSAVKGGRLVTITAVGKPESASDLTVLGQLATKALEATATGGGATA